MQTSPSLKKNKVKLEILVEPFAIDRFQKELFYLAKDENGIAILYGNDTIVKKKALSAAADKAFP